ncbi:hypothetical protein AWV79_20210 [Cupriavidus sp. UYMMa02A]|nr:hypothetical protein AWV79_20210 [Cupriavidus sp. UYMMa02A]
MRNPTLNVGKVKATLIPLLPLAGQERIVTRVEELRFVCRPRVGLTDRQTCQAHFAAALVEQTAVACPDEVGLELAA